MRCLPCHNRRMPHTPQSTSNELRGIGRLGIDATLGVTDLVEALHHNISGNSGPLPKTQNGRTSGITGLVYRAIRGSTRTVGFGLDAALALLAGPMSALKPLPEQAHLKSALNGVLGDHLINSGNALAIPMALRMEGTPLVLQREHLTAAIPHATGKLLLLVHGLCMNDTQWKQLRTDGSQHDHGQALQQAHGYTAVYLHYNTGRNIDDNGQDLAEMLETLVTAWPVAVEELNILAHSMGGLVARSAQHHAQSKAHSWPEKARKFVFLGSPHHGAPLERGGHWFDLILGATPFAAPFAKIGRIRSAGIMDLRYGGNAEKGIRLPALPRDIACFTIAGALNRKADVLHGNRPGDGLVPVDSAMGLHDQPSQTLEFPEQHRTVIQGVNHMQLLSDARVYAELEKVLKPDCSAISAHTLR